MEKFCNEDILKIAATQSGEGMNCREKDFFRDENGTQDLFHGRVLPSRCKKDVSDKVWL